METAHLVRDAVEILKRAETDNLHVYTVYADITQHFGLRRLLLSVAEQISDHLEEWQSLVSTHFPEELFHIDIAFRNRLKELEIPRMFDANMGYHDFLKMLHNREQSIAEMYAMLLESAVHPDSRFLCKRHESDSRRTMAMARDRYELEVMMDQGA